MQKESSIKGESAKSPATSPSESSALRSQVEESAAPTEFSRDSSPPPRQPCPPSSSASASPDSPPVVVHVPVEQPLEWKLRVFVTTQAPFFPKADVTVTLEEVEGAGERRAGNYRLAREKEETISHKGSGRHTFKATAESEHWECVTKGGEAQAVVDGEAVEKIDLVIRPKPWVRFKVVNEKGKKVVPGVKLKLALPEADNRNRTTLAEEEEKEVLVEDIKRGTCKVEELSHAAQIWEVVSIESA